MPTKVNLDFYEYAVFLGTLALSALIGVFYGCINTAGQNTVTGYLFGGKRMPVIPVALSLVSSYISGITLIGFPSEVYYFSTQYLLMVVSICVATTVLVFVSLPIFFKLQLVSTFEYMGLRFGRGVRTLTSLLYCISSILHSSVVIYGPALALNQVTGIGVRTISIGVCLICVFYTTLGGVKAVIWTDTLQSVIMMFSVLAVLIIGINESGGNSNVIEAAIEGDRIVFFKNNFGAGYSMDPSVRMSFWSVIVGQTSLNIGSTAFNPLIIQRLTCLPSMKAAILSSWIMGFGTIFFFSTCGYLGLVIYAMYRDCDPYTAKLISRPDQIVPYFVMDISTAFKGLCGLFLAGVVSAALSSLSTSINTLAGTIYEDFIEQRFKEKPSQGKASLAMKCISLILGVVCVSLVSVVEKLGHMLELAIGFAGSSQGALLGLFLLGFFQPRANNKGATIGGLASLVSTLFLLIGNSLNKMNGAIETRLSVLNVDGCPFNVTLNTTDAPPFDAPTKDVFPLFEIPVLYYTIVGSLIVVVVGSVASLFLEDDVTTQNVRLDCLSPWVRRFARRPSGKTYDSVPVKEETVALPERYCTHAGK